MIRSFTAVLLIASALIASAIALDLPYWALPPEQKFAKAWREDLQLLENTKHFPEAWKDLASVEFTSDDSIVQDWYQRTHSPFATNKNGNYKLQILGIHLLDGYRYGVVLQYNWIDLKSGNTVGELGRTLKLGIVY